MNKPTKLISKTFLLTLFTTTLFTLPTFGKAPPQTVRLNMLEEPASLNPTEARDVRSSAVISHLFDGLVRRNPSNTLEPSLAHKYTLSENGKVYTFFLRESKWSNNTPISAEDFLYAWQKALDPLIPSNPDLLYVIKNAKKIKSGELPMEELGVSTVDEHTLVIELEEPTPYFLDLLTKPIFFPIPKCTDEKNPKWYTEADSYVSNGPFSIHEWNHHNHIFLKPNPLYWDRKAVSLNGIAMFMTEQSKDLSMYEMGVFNRIGSPLSQLTTETIENHKKEDMGMRPALCTYFLRTQTENKLLSSKLIRQALAKAINRKKITDEILFGRISPAKTLVPLSMGITTHLSEENTPYFTDNDPEEALDLFEQGLNQLSLTRDNLPPLTLILMRGERTQLISQSIVKYWKNTLDITVKTQVVSDKEWFTRTSKGDFDIAAGSWSADFNDPMTFLQVFKHKNGNTNNTSWENPQYIKLLDEASIAPSEEERFSYYQKAEALLLDDMPIIPICYIMQTYMQYNNLQNVIFTPLGTIDFKWAKFTTEE